MDLCYTSSVDCSLSTALFLPTHPQDIIMNRRLPLTVAGLILASATSVAAQRAATPPAPILQGAGNFPVPHPTPEQYLKLNKALGTVWAGEGPRFWKPLPTVAAITANDLRSR